MTTPIDSAAPGRWQHVLGHLRYAAWLAFHPRAPLAEGPLSIPIGPRTRTARILAVKDVAERLGVAGQERDGVITAERWWGPLRVRAQVVARDYTRQHVFPEDAFENAFRDLP